MALIMMTYRADGDPQITGGPDWIKTEVFDIQAKGESGGVGRVAEDDQGGAGRKSIAACCENLLAESLSGCKSHHESRVEPIYTLVVDDAAKLKAFDGDCPPIVPGAPPPNIDPSKGAPPCGAMFMHVRGASRATRLRFRRCSGFCR